MERVVSSVSVLLCYSEQFKYHLPSRQIRTRLLSSKVATQMYKI